MLPLWHRDASHLLISGSRVITEEWHVKIVQAIKKLGVECRSSDNTDSIFGLPSCSCPHNDLHLGLEVPGPWEVNVCPDQNGGRFVLIFLKVAHRKLHFG